MARENNYLAIILKKQPFGEGDEILTLFTKEAGKIRGLAKSTKLPKSKLQYALQALFLSKITTTKSSALPKIIRAETVKTFSHIRESLLAAKIAFYAIELLIKFTADEHKNEQLYNLSESFFGFLDSNSANERLLQLGLAKYKSDFLDCLGLGIHFEIPGDDIINIGFSNSRGGFLFEESAADYKHVDLKTFEVFAILKKAAFSELPNVFNNYQDLVKNADELQELLSSFIRYQLERDVRSEQFLSE